MINDTCVHSNKLVDLDENDCLVLLHESNSQLDQICLDVQPCYSFPELLFS